MSKRIYIISLASLIAVVSVLFMMDRDSGNGIDTTYAVVSNVLDGGKELVDVATKDPNGFHSDISLANDSSENTSRVVSRMPAGVYNVALSIKGHGSGVSSEGISEAVDRVVGVVDATYRERHSDLQELRGMEDLPIAETRRLLNYLSDANREQGMSDQSFYVLVNDLVAVFHDQRSLNDSYISVSAELISDIAEKEVIRDYTLQGLSRGYHNATDEQAEVIRTVFWDGLQFVNSSLAGTALLALDRVRVSGDFTVEEEERFRETLGRLVKSDHVNERVRIPVIQLIASMDMKSEIHVIENLLDSNQLTFSEKIAAKAAINQLSATKSYATDSYVSK